MDAPCPIRCGTLKNPHCSMAMSISRNLQPFTGKGDISICMIWVKNSRLGQKTNKQTNKQTWNFRWQMPASSIWLIVVSQDEDFLSYWTKTLVSYLVLIAHKSFNLSIQYPGGRQSLFNNGSTLPNPEGTDSLLITNESRIIYGWGLSTRTKQ